MEVGDKMCLVESVLNAWNASRLPSGHGSACPTWDVVLAPEPDYLPSPTCPASDCSACFSEVSRVHFNLALCRSQCWGREKDWFSVCVCVCVVNLLYFRVRAKATDLLMLGKQGSSCGFGSPSPAFQTEENKLKESSAEES